MKCPDCSGNLRVIDSRPRCGLVRRVRRCVSCGKDRETYETFWSVWVTLDKMREIRERRKAAEESLAADTTNRHLD